MQENQEVGPFRTWLSNRGSSLMEVWNNAASPFFAALFCLMRIKMKVPLWKQEISPFPATNQPIRASNLNSEVPRPGKKQISIVYKLFRLGISCSSRNDWYQHSDLQDDNGCRIITMTQLKFIQHPNHAPEVPWLLYKLSSYSSWQHSKRFKMPNGLPKTRQNWTSESWVLELYLFSSQWLGESSLWLTHGTIITQHISLDSYIFLKLYLLVKLCNWLCVYVSLHS